MISSNAARPARNALMKVALFLGLALSLSVGAHAQGWQLVFGDDKEDEGYAIVQTVDHGFLLAGWSESFGNPFDQDIDFYLVKVDVDGTLVWQEVYDGGYERDDFAYGVVETEDNGFLVVGEAEKEGGSDLYLLKVDPNGNFEWDHHFEAGPDVLRARGNDIIPTSDGGYLITGFRETADGDEDALAIKINSQGEAIWTKYYGSPTLDEAANAVTRFQDGYAIVGTRSVTPTDVDVIVLRIDADGNMVWDDLVQWQGVVPGENRTDEALDVIESSQGHIVWTGSANSGPDAVVAAHDAAGNLLWEHFVDRGIGDSGVFLEEKLSGNIFVAGFTEDSNEDINHLYFEVAADGSDTLWTKSVGDQFFDKPNDFVSTISGGYMSVGVSGVAGVIGSLPNLTLVKSDAQGNIRTNYVEGRIFRDLDGNCEFNFDDNLEGWLVKAENANATYFGSSNANGRYYILADTGEFLVTLMPPGPDIWQACEGFDSTLVTFETFYDSITVDFPVDTLGDPCPYLEIDVTAPFLNPCSEVVYTVTYCNVGTEAAIADETEITIELDDELTLIDASIPFTDEDTLYRFDLGDILVTECGQFTITTEAACGGIVQGQAGWVEAQIYPQDLCQEPDTAWDGSSIIVSGVCEPDLVRFNITNVGEPMDTPRTFFVVEDDFLLLQDTFKLPEGGIKADTFAKNGATYRLIAQQSAFHPGMSFPTFVIEGCAEDGTVEYSTEYVTQFPENDRDAYIAIDVQEIVGSLNDPIELRGYPKGYGAQRLVDDSTDITYTIFFSNTGTDTITRVVIRDTLPPELDLQSLQLGSSSHPYQLQIYDEGILKFTFSGIQLLPGSSASDPKAYGFIKFKLSQKQDIVTDGAQITNSAAIYFENEAPRITNTVRHRVRTLEFPWSEIPVSSQETFVPGVEIKIAPNPFKEQATFEIEGLPRGEVMFELIDATGRLVSTKTFRGNRFEFQRRNLQPGVYFYRLTAEGQLINTGKVLVR